MKKNTILFILFLFVLFINTIHAVDTESIDAALPPIVQEPGGGSGGTSTGVIKFMFFSSDSPSSASSSSNGLNFGHTFLAIRNTTLNTITVGHKTIVSGEYVTIGTWGSANNRDVGLWYNLESWRIQNLSEMNGRASIEYYITYNQLDSINEILTNTSTDYWNIFYNCADFAVDIWNQFSLYPVNKGNWSSMTEPAFIKSSIMTYNHHSINHPLVTIGSVSYVKNGQLYGVNNPGMIG